MTRELDGKTLSPPHGSTVVKKLEKDFVIAASGDINLVAWQDGSMVCVIASKLPSDRLLALAAEIALQG